MRAFGIVWSYPKGIRRCAFLYVSFAKTYHLKLNIVSYITIEIDRNNYKFSPRLISNNKEKLTISD